MNKKDTYRNYAIWALLLIFYAVFYFLNNKAWIEEIPVVPTAQAPPVQMISTSDSIGDPDTATPVISLIDKRDTPVSTRSTDTRSTRTSSRSRYTPKRKSREAKPIHINEATEEDWQTLYNIGPYRAGRIVNFRNALGGFYTVDQVGETYGLPDSVFRVIKPFLLLDSIWKYITINTAEYDSLYLHPYITKQMAYFIVRHRENNGPIQYPDELYNIIREKDHEKLRKLEPYLDFGIK